MASDNTKRKVYFNEFNVLMRNVTYLPFVSGLLCAYAKTSDKIVSNYEFEPFLFYRDIPERIIEKYRNPSVAAFSVNMWNEQLNLYVAQKIKQQYPKCLIILGGPQVPFKPKDYHKQYPFIDITVRGAGEEVFLDILLRNIESNDYGGISGIAWQDSKTGLCVINPGKRGLPRDLDKYPSPYLEGLYEYIFTENRRLTFQAIIETNRGCPFNCAYCFWGKGGLSTKFQFHSLERIKAEIEWFAKHEIKYVFNADSNFGMHKRDYEIATFLAEAKKKYGYPEKLRTCFGKNTDDRIFQIASIMHKNGLEKGVTLSKQSNSEEVLKNIGRKNIKMSTFTKLQQQFNDKNIPVYSELILALPGETYTSWIEGIESHLQGGFNNQLFIYLCEVYPNTELADPEYMKRFGIEAKRIVLTEIHASPRKDNDVNEYQEVVVGTNSMPTPIWRKALKFSCVTMLLHSMKLGFFILKYLVDRYGIAYTDLIRYICEGKMPPDGRSIFIEELEYFEAMSDNLLRGRGRGHILPEFGEIYWEVEEASFLRISEKLNQFYDEFLNVFKHFLTEKGFSYDEKELAEAVAYQKMRIPMHSLSEETQRKFSFNFPEYFDFCLSAVPVPLRHGSQTLVLHGTDYKNDKRRYAREVILWGRKSGTMLVDASWR